MKKVNFKLFAMLFSTLLIMFIVACDNDEDEKTNAFLPVYEKNFSYTVDEDNNVTFTTTLTGTVWITFNGIDYTASEQTVTFFVAKSGTYSCTCSCISTEDGTTYTSEAFDLVIGSDKTDFLNSGLWLYLSGGVDKTKTWRIDIDSDGECAYFDGPLYYSGTDDYPYWAWDVLESELPYTLADGTEMTTFFNWSPSGTSSVNAQDYGTITFDGTYGTVETTKFGTTETGTFTMDTTTWQLTINGVVIPIDTARLDEGQFTDDNLSNVRIMTISGNSMQIGVKRSYELDKDKGVLEEKKWLLVYNFICTDSTYVKEQFTYSDPVLTSFTQSDLVGTWKYDSVAQNWIGWHGDGDMGTTIEAALLNGWSTYTEMVESLVSWSATTADSIFKANFDNVYVFNSDGSCTLDGASNTYSINNGVITFGTALAETEFTLVWITLTGTEVSVLDIKKDADGNEYTYDGIWIGQQNGDGATQSAAVHLIKQ